MLFSKAKTIITVLLSGALLLAGVSSAQAHVSTQAYGEKYYAGGGATLFLRVPHAKADASTVKIVVELPENLGIVKPAHIGGWVESSTFSADMKNTLTLTWDGGNLPDTSFQDFGMKLTLPKTPGVLYFKTVQYFNDGTTEGWVQIPTGDGASLAQPAPSYTVVDKASAVDVAQLKKDLDEAKAQIAVLASVDAVLTGVNVNVLADLKSTLKRKAYSITDAKGAVLYKGKINSWGDFDVTIRNKGIATGAILTINVDGQKAINVTVK